MAVAIFDGHPGANPPFESTYRRETIIFELFSGLLPEIPVRAPGLGLTEINVYRIIFGVW